MFQGVGAIVALCGGENDDARRTEKESIETQTHRVCIPDGRCMHARYKERRCWDYVILKAAESSHSGLATPPPLYGYRAVKNR